MAQKKTVHKAKNSKPDKLDQADSRVVRVPGWDEIPWLHAGFSTRLGGVSTVYAGEEGPQNPNSGDLNLGWTASDDPRRVAENRQLLQQAVDAAEMAMVSIRQIHSGVVRIVKKDSGPFATKDGKAVLRGDGLMTDVPGLLLAAQVADCVPVIVVDVKQKVVAAFHAGWRGTVKRIVQHGVGTMQLEYGSRPKDLIAAIGPSIGSCCYAVGEEVRSEFFSQFAYASKLFREVDESGPQIHVDLWEANRRQLLDAGLKKKNIAVLRECSGCAVTKDGRKKYFSHRKEHGFTGRMMAVVGIS